MAEQQINNFKPWILSGGLSPKNINNALEITKAKYIDVSSGIEYSLGKKNHNLMKEFVLNAKI